MEQRFETFTVLINRISRNIRKIKNQEMAEFHLRSAHISCLYYLYISRGLTAAELCEQCEEDKATVSRALEYLQEIGCLARDASPKRYKSPLLLTDMEETTFTYKMVARETIQPTDFEAMEAGDWDLTLFTCTVGGQTRVTIRFEREEE